MTHPDGRHRNNGERRGPSKRGVAIVLVVCAVVVAVTASAWAMAVQLDDDAQAEGTPEEDSAPADAASRQLPEAALRPVNECVDALELADEAVAAAQPGIENWEEHIRAHTDLLDGEIELDEAEDIFDRTSDEGPDDLARFDEAEEAYLEVADQCEGLEDTDAPNRYAPAIEACQFYATAAQSAVEAAGESLDDWREHLADERKHRQGDLTGDEAQERWVEAWRNGGPRITSFHSAVDQRDSTPECTPPTPSAN